MNIFILHKDPVISAKLHGKLLGNKLILEGTQMLSHVARTQAYNPEEIHESIYKPFKIAGYIKHPCTIWAGASQLGFEELLIRTTELINIWKPNHACALPIGFLTLMYYNNKIHFDKTERLPYVMAFNTKSGLKYHANKILSDKEVIRLYRLYHKTKWYSKGETDHLLTDKCWNHLSKMIKIDIIKNKKSYKELVWPN